MFCFYRDNKQYCFLFIAIKKTTSFALCGHFFAMAAEARGLACGPAISAESPTARESRYLQLRQRHECTP